MSGYAIVEIGNRQYRVQENDVILVEKIDSASNQEVSFDRVLMLKSEKDFQVGKPYVSGASITCQVLDLEQQPKVISYEYRRRKNSRRKKGHRQVLTRLQVKEIKG